MKNYLKTIRQILLTIQKNLDAADAKFTMRAAVLLLYILDSKSPVSYADIFDNTGIEQSKAATMTQLLINCGVVSKTVNEKSLTSFISSQKGEQLRDDLLNRMRKLYESP